MPEVTVSQFANAIGISVERLQEQLVSSGLPKKIADEIITDEEKNNLLNYLRGQHGKDSIETRKITLKRKTSSEIKVMVFSTQSRNKVKQKTVNVEFRKKHTYMKRSALEDAEKYRLQAKLDAEKKALAADAVKKEAVKDQVVKDKAVTADVASSAKVVSDVATSPTHPTDTPAKGKAEDAIDTATVNDKDIKASAVSVKADVATTDASADATDAKKEPEKNKASSKKSKDTNKKAKSGDKRTRYGRQELHVATEKSGRRRKRSRRHKLVPVVEARHGFEKPVMPVVREIEIPQNISVSDLSRRMSVKATEVIKLIMELGSMVTINQMLDQDTAALVVSELGHEAKLINESALEDELIHIERSNSSQQVVRAPVVTVMGHVDHGKTSLIDYIRSSKVADGEVGGITQSMGAYVVERDQGSIVFLDTPGHAVFTSMRARGADITDIIVLVVAADDGVMPQTKESVEYARKKNVPIIVAVNKIDKVETDAENIKQELSNFGVIPEDWGGDTQFVKISAKTGIGIDELLNSILLQAELLELKVPETGAAVGSVIEARLDKGRGPIATILTRSGQLKVGDMILSGQEFGNVRALLDTNGREIFEPVGPSTPVEVLGLSKLPDVGDEIVVVPDEKKAREVSEHRKSKVREAKLAKQHAVKLQNAMHKMNEAEAVVLNALVKADTQGAVEAVIDLLSTLSTPEVMINVISSGVGNVTETDVHLARASKAMIVGFNIHAGGVHKFADSEDIEMHFYNIIYELLDEMKDIMVAMLKPIVHENIVGTAEVKDIFPSQKFGSIAGCLVSTGMIQKTNFIRVMRNDKVVFEGNIESLKHFKDDVSRVKSGTECGICMKYDGVQRGDHIEVFEKIETKRTL